MDDYRSTGAKKRKRQYATHRITKSVRKSETPGVQVFSLRDEMPEIKQTEYRRPAKPCSSQGEQELPPVTAYEGDRFAGSLWDMPPPTDVSNDEYMWLVRQGVYDCEAWFRRWSTPIADPCLTKLLELRARLEGLETLVLASTLIQERVPSFDADEAATSAFRQEVQSTLLRGHWPLFSTAKQAMESMSGLVPPLAMWCKCGRDHHRFWRVLESALQGMRQAIATSNNEALREVLGREEDIIDTYQSHKHEHIAEKHRDFVASCGALLHEAQQRHNIGDSSLLNLLLEHEVPEKWWKTGWQRFLDHVSSTGQVDAMKSLIAEARSEVGRFKEVIPELREHYDDCLRELDGYSRRLHMSLEPGGMSPTMLDGDGGGGVDDPGGHSPYDFAAEWTVPLSGLCSTVLQGWHMLGRRVSFEVYKRVGYTFCMVDLKWL